MSLKLNSQVTDASLPVLKRLTRLSRLRLSQTGISENGLDELKRALPGCAIERL